MTRIITSFAFILTSFVTINAQNYSDSISVNIFLLDQCKISQNISAEINRVHGQFSEKQFYFQAYFPNFSSKPEKIKDFMEKYKIGIPYKTDYFKTKAKFYEATIAPEVVVYDEKNKVTLYRGRIDNSYDKIGSRRRVVTSKDLYSALSNISAGLDIPVKETNAIGCFINFNELNTN